MKAAMHDSVRAAAKNRLKSSSCAARLRGLEADAIGFDESENPQGRFERRSGTVDGVVAVDNAP